MPKDKGKKRKDSSEESDSGSASDEVRPSKKQKPTSNKKKNQSSSSSDELEPSPPPVQKRGNTSATKNKDNEICWTLAKNKILKIREFRGKTYIDIREYYMNANGDTLPTKKGISLTPEVYQKLKSLISEIDDELKKI